MSYNVPSVSKLYIKSVFEYDLSTPLHKIYELFIIRRYYTVYGIRMILFDLNKLKKFVSFLLFQAASGEWVLAAADSQSVGGGGFVRIGECGRIGCRGGRRRGRCT